MAFLDNSGDIILDAVLTDTGRMRLAKGDGSFRIAKFALGDDEIDYGLFNKSHANGSAYYDLEIMQTPVLEAFTNNTSLLKYKLMSFSRTNLLYLPVMKLNDISKTAAIFDSSNNVTATAPGTEGTGVYILPADDTTKNALTAQGKDCADGKGILSSDFKSILIYQGLDTNDVSFKQFAESELIERQYIIKVDSRVATIHTDNLSTQADSSFIDDDLVAHYYLTQNNDSTYVSDLSWTETDQPQSASEAVMKGPKGTKLMFNLKPTLDLESSNTLFEELGGGAGNSITMADGSGNYYYIDTNVRVTGATTGYSIDIPIRAMKKY